MKMKIDRYIRGAFTSIALLLIINVATGQSKEVILGYERGANLAQPREVNLAQPRGLIQNSPLSIELMKARSLWFNTGNGAGIVMDQMNNYTLLEGSYNHKDGEFKLKQEGEKEGIAQFLSEGGINLGRGYAWGSFLYDNITLRNTEYNTAMLDPFRGVPYYPVDPNPSDWKKQYYSLHMKVGTAPLWDRLVLGIEGDYTARVGAKQRDPRSELYFYTANIKPGALMMFGEHTVGLNFEYENLKQETRGHSNSDTQVDQEVFVMKGLGNHYTSVIGGRQSLKSFLYNGNKVGGEAQYSFEREYYKLLVSGGYSFRVEDVISDATKPKKEGSVKENLYYANLSFLMEGDNLNRIDFNYRNSKISGIEYVQELDLTYEVQQWVDLYSSIRSNFNEEQIALSYSFYRNADHNYKWKGRLYGEYSSIDQLYLMPKSILDGKNLYFGGEASFNFDIGRASIVTLGANGQYKHNLSGDYNYGGAAPDAIVITNFMTPDFEYLTESFYKVGVMARLFAPFSATSRSSFYIKAAVDYYKPIELDGNRLLSTIGIGFTF